MQTETNQSLIMPGRHEILLEKINSFRQNNMTAKELEAFEQEYYIFISSFRNLCWKHFGLSLENLRQLNKEELVDLADIIYQKTYRRANVQIILLYILVCTPPLGWFPLAMGAYKNMWALRYRDKYQKLLIKKLLSLCFLKFLKQLPGQ